VSYRISCMCVLCAVCCMVAPEAWSCLGEHQVKQRARGPAPQRARAGRPGNARAPGAFKINIEHSPRRRTEEAVSCAHTLTSRQAGGRQWKLASYGAPASDKQPFASGSVALLRSTKGQQGTTDHIAKPPGVESTAAATALQIASQGVRATSRGRAAGGTRQVMLQRNVAETSRVARPHSNI
jgi:hypothetical protein